MPRDLPSNITIPSFDAYQVRIVRDGHEYSATFAWSRYGSKDQALLESVAWRDALLARLPPAATSLGSWEDDMPKYLMNPATGSVDTEENWLAEMPTWEGDQQAQFDSLVEVVKHEDGQWVEVK